MVPAAPAGPGGQLVELVSLAGSNSSDTGGAGRIEWRACSTGGAGRTVPRSASLESQGAGVESRAGESSADESRAGESHRSPRKPCALAGLPCALPLRVRNRAQRRPPRQPTERFRARAPQDRSPQKPCALLMQSQPARRSAGRRASRGPSAATLIAAAATLADGAVPSLRPAVWFRAHAPQDWLLRPPRTPTERLSRTPAHTPARAPARAAARA